jgi:precorrin-6B methylase 2
VLHSPFVFKLYNTCIKRKKTKDFSEVNELLGTLKNNHSLVTQTDYGTSNPTIKRKTVANLGYKNGIELGTSLGISACYQGLALKQHQGHLITIEGAPELNKIALQHFEQLALTQTITAVTGTFDETLPTLLNQINTIDYAFIDGNHRYEPTIKYFNWLLPKMHNNSLIVFDDIYWSKGMTKAWEEIKAHPQVSVTVDLFFIGLVFFRKEQVKEHFKLRVF